MISRKAKVDLEHQVWKLVKENELQNKKILVAISGGIDSVALLRVLSKIHKNVYACYFHHGEGSNLEYRKKAELFCEKLCKKWDIPIFLLRSAQLAKSEAQYRELRYEALQNLMEKEEFACVALGHHRDDLLETRILRLIRGTGGQGLQAMEIFKDKKFRPFLETSKAELKGYLRGEKVRSLEDPTNKNLDPLRNWLREEWLPQLEKRQKGSLASFSRSLEILAHELATQKNNSLLLHNDAFETKGLSRAFYLSLSLQEQTRLLAQYLLSLGVKNFSQSQLEEIQKRLDKPQKVITFKVGSCQWEINAEQIKVQS